VLRAKASYLPAAIEIGTNSLKLLQLAKFRSSFKVVKADYVVFENNKGDSSPILRDTLGQLIRENQVKGDVATSIPLNRINTYSYILPSMPVDEIESAIIWKIKQNLTPGTHFDDLSFDYVCCNPQKDGDKDIHALVFVINKKIVMDMIKFFKDLSLDLISVEPQPYAIIEVLSLSKNISEQETVLVLQLGATNSSIIIVSSGHPYLIMPLAVSGKGFTEALANYYQFDWAKAEALKIKAGLGELQLNEAQNASEASCFPVLSSQLENMIIDIEHTFKYFSQQFAKSKAPAIERLVLCGGTAALKNLDKFLSNALKVPVNVFDPVDFFTSHSEYEVSPVVKNNSTAFASALGLATKFINGGLGFEIKAS